MSFHQLYMFYKMAEHWQSIVGNDTSAIYATNIAQHWASLRYTSREREREREREIAFIKIVFALIILNQNLVKSMLTKNVMYQDKIAHTYPYLSLSLSHSLSLSLSLSFSLPPSLSLSLSHSLSLFLSLKLLIR